MSNTNPRTTRIPPKILKKSTRASLAFRRAKRRKCLCDRPRSAESATRKAGRSEDGWVVCWEARRQHCRSRAGRGSCRGDREGEDEEGEREMVEEKEVEAEEGKGDGEGEM